MRKQKIKFILCLLLFTVSMASLIGCTSSGNDQSQQTPPPQQQDTDSDNSSSEQDNTSQDSSKPSKEELLENMLDIPMEDFEVVDLEGNKVKLSDYKGKIIFLNFWATWCPPCREEMPLLQEAYEQYKDEDVVIFTVNSTSLELRGGNDSDKAKQQVIKFLDDTSYTFPVYLDPTDDAWSIYQQRGIPTNYIIDKEGIIRYGFAGPYSSKEQIQMFIENIRTIES